MSHKGKFKERCESSFEALSPNCPYRSPVVGRQDVELPLRAVQAQGVVLTGNLLVCYKKHEAKRHAGNVPIARTADRREVSWTLGE